MFTDRSVLDDVRATPRVARAGIEICDYPERNLYQLKIWRPLDELHHPRGCCGWTRSMLSAR